MTVGRTARTSTQVAVEGADPSAKTARTSTQVATGVLTSDTSARTARTSIQVSIPYTAPTATAGFSSWGMIPIGMS